MVKIDDDGGGGRQEHKELVMQLKFPPLQFARWLDLGERGQKCKASVSSFFTKAVLTHGMGRLSGSAEK